MRTILGILTLALTGIFQFLMIANPAPADWFFMATGAAIFTLALSLHVCGSLARRILLANALIMMCVVGMRFDAAPALVGACALFVASLVAAGIAHAKSGQ